MTYANKLNQLASTIEAAFDDYFGQNLRGKDIIDDSMQYSLKAGGKRIRPILLLEVCKAYGGDIDQAMPFAVAIEMIHTYSLIHDDLPCMDNDDLRRGKPTNHVVYGYDIAVLAGDGLLNLAAETMTHACLQMPHAQRGLKAMQTILSASGSSGMILGQVADIKFQSDDMMVETLDYINAYKTGKMLTASILAGAILAGVESEELNQLEHIGNDIGLLFQLVDDLLDIVGNAEKLGKRTQMDIQNEKVTYPLLLGIDKTHERIEELQKTLMEKIKGLSITSEFLIETIQFLVNREY